MRLEPLRHGAERRKGEPAGHRGPDEGNRLRDGLGEGLLRHLHAEVLGDLLHDRIDDTVGQRLLGQLLGHLLGEHPRHLPHGGVRGLGPEHHADEEREHSLGVVIEIVVVGGEQIGPAVEVGELLRDAQHMADVLGQIGRHRGGQGEDSRKTGSRGERAHLGRLVADGGVGHPVQNVEGDARRRGGLLHRLAQLILRAVTGQRRPEVRLPVDPHTRKPCRARQKSGEAGLRVLAHFARDHARKVQQQGDPYPSNRSS